MTINVQVQGGTVTITVGGQPSTNSGNGTVVSQGNVGGAAGNNKTGGDGATEDPGPGSGGPANGSSAMVIGPIVVSGSALQATNGQSNANGTKTGGDGATEDPGPGSGGPGNGSGAFVIGPIVIGGQAASAAAGNATPPAKGVSVNPDVAKAKPAAKKAAGKNPAAQMGRR
jgi:hypothetical protein